MDGKSGNLEINVIQNDMTAPIIRIESSEIVMDSVGEISEMINGEGEMKKEEESVVYWIVLEIEGVGGLIKSCSEFLKDQVKLSIFEMVVEEERELWNEAIEMLLEKQGGYVELISHLKCQGDECIEVSFQGYCVPGTTSMILVGHTDNSRREGTVNTILCRICEKMIPFTEFEKHSFACAQVNRIELLIVDLNEDLDFLIKMISSRIEFEQGNQSIVSYCNEMLDTAENTLSSMLTCDSFTSSLFLDRIKSLPLISVETENDENQVNKILLWRCKRDQDAIDSGMIDIGLMLELLIQQKAKLSKQVQPYYEILSKDIPKQMKQIEMKKFDLAPPPVDVGSPRSIRSSFIEGLTNTQSTASTTINDFEIIKPISKGAFGRVYLAKKKQTKEYFAIKVIKKQEASNRNQLSQLRAEQMILASMDCPFIVKIYYSFQTKNNLYFVLEYLNGGDCSSLLKAVGCLDEDWARQYAAHVVLALETLHKSGYIHRDLKPDNLLIDQNGHLKLTDFGLSKIGQTKKIEEEEEVGIVSLKPKSSSVLNSQSYLELDRRLRGSNPSSPFRPRKMTGASSISVSTASSTTSSMDGSVSPNDSHKAIGTADYMAPEVLTGKPHATTMDWWSVGVILYEFLFGIPPFNAETLPQIFENILNCRIVYPSEPEISPEAMDLLKGLLAFDPEKRLGRDGAESIKSHPFFESVDWDGLIMEQGVFVPQPDNEEDTAYFDSRGAKNMSLIADQESPHVDSSFKVEITSEPLEEQILQSFTFKNLNLLEKANQSAINQHSSPSSPALIHRAQLSHTFKPPKSESSKLLLKPHNPKFLSQSLKPTCIIAEDNPLVRKVLETLLTTRLNCKVISSCPDGKQALLKILEQKVDFVLLDIQMPHLTGDLVARCIKNMHNPNSTTPILAVTAYEIKRFEDFDFDCVIHKPITKEKLLDSLCKFLK